MSGPTSQESVAATPPYKPRMLVLCFDGTTNQYDGDNTNVVKFFSMLRKDCDDEQICYYQTGIGTYGPPGMWSTLGTWISKVTDEAFAWYLDTHVMDGYKYLMNNYRPGDKISIFGFSRGAYTARALAGFLTKIGLLPRDNDQQVTFAYKMYKRTDSEGLVLAAGFKETFCRSVDVEFLGVWDTVASTGVIMSRNLPFTTNNKMIKTFRHALALDERRAKFVPTFWQLSTPQPPVPKPGLGASPAALSTATRNTVNGSKNPKSAGDSSDANEQGGDAQREQLLDSKQKEKKGKKSWWSFRNYGVRARDSIDPEESDMDTTDVKQVWFVGGHSDVGGGAEKNTADGTLADIPLRWMVREIVDSKCGILFDPVVMASLNVHPTLPPAEYFATSGTSSEIASGSQPSEKDCSADKIDATKTLHDELRLMPIWWILEVVPLPFSWQDSQGKWHKKWEFHLGRGRYVNQSGALLFHETVRVRMNDPNLRYTPAAKYQKGKESYVW